MPIVLNDVTQLEKLSLINSNFQKIEDAINSSLLWKTGSTVGEASMSRSLDLNNNQILNALVGNLRLSELGEDLTASVASAAASASSAAVSEGNSLASAQQATASAVSAAGSATNAQVSADSIAASAAQIVTNTSNISANTSAISANTGAIASNTSDISALTSRMSAEETKVQPVALGGTGGTTQATARTGIGAAASGANTDITSITGSAATLTTGRTLQTNLASTSATSFNGSANITLGVTGTLAVGNGGTGATTVLAAPYISKTGIVTGTAAAAGQVGEIINATGSATSLTVGTPTNLASISLTAGCWQVRGTIAYVCTASALTGIQASISTTSGAGAMFPNILINFSPSLGTNQTCQAPSYILNISATTTIYIVGYANFSSGTTTGTGFVEALRIR